MGLLHEAYLAPRVGFVQTRMGDKTRRQTGDKNGQIPTTIVDGTNKTRPSRLIFNDNSHLKFGLFNARSVRNKTPSIVELVLEHSLDLLGITETWLKVDDYVILGDLSPPGFTFHHIPRSTNTEGYGGGVGFLIRSELKHELVKFEHFSSFEAIEAVVKASNEVVRIISIYRPPQSTVNRMTWQGFLEELSDLLSHHTTSSGRLIIMGDMNIHVNNKEDSKTKQLGDLLASYNLTQLITQPTHIYGNTLDIICVRDEEDVIRPESVEIFPPGVLSDHAWINFSVSVKKPPSSKKKITYRPWKVLNKNLFKQHLLDAADSVMSIPHMSVNEVYATFATNVTRILDDTIPLKSKLITSKPAPPWYSHEIQLERANRRRLEKKWRRTRSNEDLDEYKRQCSKVKTLLHRTKKDFYMNQIERCDGNQKKLFGIVNNLLYIENHRRCFQIQTIACIWLRNFLIFSSRRLKTFVLVSAPLTHPTAC